MNFSILRSALEKSISPLNLFIPQYRLPVWIGLIIPIAIAVTLLSSVGPLFQAHTLPLPVSFASSIYETIYHNSTAHFPSLRQWLANAASMNFLIIGAIVAIYSFKSNNYYDIVLRCGFYFFATYMISDLFNMIVNRNYKSIGQDTIANVFGGVLCAVFIYFILAVIKSIDNTFSRSMPSFVIKIASILSIGTTTSISVYILLITFYQPLQANIEIVASLPLKGMIAPYEDASTDDKSKLDSAKKNSTLLRQSELSKFYTFSTLTYPSIDWQLSPDGPTYSVDVFFQEGCLNGAPDTEGMNPILSAKNIHNLILSGDISAVTLRGENEIRTTLNIDNPTFFHIKHSLDVNSLDLDFFITKSDHIKFSSDDGFKLLLSAVTIDERNRNAHKDISSIIDGLVYKFNLSPKNVNSSRRESPCRVIDGKGGNITRHDNNFEIETSNIISGVFFSIKRSEKDDQDGYLSNESVASLSNLNSWASFDGVQIKTASFLATTDFVLLDGGFGSVLIDGIQISKEWDSLYIYGNVHIYRPYIDKLRLSGIAHLINRNNSRINATRWEALSSEWHIPIISALLATCGAGFVWARRTLSQSSNPDPKDWI